MFRTRRMSMSVVLTCVLCCAAFAQDDRAGQQRATAPTVTASATGERVRFAIPNAIAQLRLEVYNEAGQKIFDTELRGGTVADWHLQDGEGNRVVAGSYACLLTIRSLSGRISQKLGLVAVEEKSAAVRPVEAAGLSAQQAQAVGPVEGNTALAVLAGNEPPAITAVTHDGEDAQLTRTRGALSFRAGDFFSGRDREQMRLTEDGKLGIGTDQPEARLDVNGMIRARSGFQFSDGSVLNLSPKGGLSITLPSGKSAPVNLSPNAVAGTANYIPRFASDGNSLLDSVLYQNPSTGFIGWGTATPAHPFTVLRNGGSAGVHSFGELYVDRNDRNRSASMILGTAGTLKWIFGMPYQDDGFQIFDLLASPSPGVSRLYVHPTNGNIGVGTNSPTYKLHVLNSSNAGLRVQTNATGGDVASFGGNGNFRIDAPEVVGGRLSVRDNGNVGIGTDSPTAKLDVRGDIKLGPSGQYQAASGEEKLRIVRGVIDKFGTIITGTGFTVEPSSGFTGRYSIVFNTPFASPPAVTITAAYSNDNFLLVGSLDGVTASGFNAVIQLFNDSLDDLDNTAQTFHFIAIGPR